ncbi:carboxylesterase/lipase family protein [Streptomyces sp. I05A-00742]|uniref:carboxylesterase/lipase family protein n=1 Tax=Streptomyces sp. I05A-00742 TaxID=2732853 RepID=UPI00148851E9|nr:carboxylesterase family protein [Streptomyces sp. I05A-00742]
MTGDRQPVVRTAYGPVRGIRDGAVSAFLGIPYAAPPVGPARFAPPRPVGPWREVRDATAPGPIAPQPPSRLEQVMGRAPFARTTQDEDCLTVNVWTPGADGGAGRPVLVFLHGGGFSSGAGGLGWYAGTELAERGDIVVVTVNYRLGALGYARLGDLLPDAGPGNQGLLDQLQALRWVRENIPAFGGDPDRITVAGQSAGAVSIVSLLSGPEGRGLFRRAILQSYPGGMLPQTPDEAAARTSLLLDCLGIPEDRAPDIRSVPVADVLAAQGGVVRRAPHHFLDVTPAFQLVADGRFVAPDPVAAVAATAAHGVRLLIGTTRDEGAAFFAPGSPLLHGATKDDFARTSESWFGDASRYTEWEALDPAAQAVRMTTEHFFRAPAERLAALLADSGNPAWLYRLDHTPESSPFGACHCLELPFVFGNPDAWSDAPMLRGADPKETAALVERFQDSWIAFVREGDPRHAGLPDWQPYLRERPGVTVIG